MAQRQNIKRNSDYVFGNAVRKAAPARRDRRQELRDERESHARSEQIRRNQEKHMRMSFPFVLFLAAASVCAVFVCFQYLSIQTSINGRMNHIQTLQDDISGLRQDNKALQTRIDTYYNLDYIYQVATQELGMTYASADQVIVYNRTESEFVRQYDDIPD